MTPSWWAVSLLLVVAFSGCLFGDDDNGGDGDDDGSPTTSVAVSGSPSPSTSPSTSPSASPTPSPSPSNGTNTTNSTSPSPSPTPRRLPVTWDVEVRDNSFAPAQVTIQRGDTVRWTHNGFADHALVGDGWQSHPQCPAGDCFDRSEKFTHTFTDLGTEVVYCRLHGGTSTGQGMAMSVVVKERHEATP